MTNLWNPPKTKQEHSLVEKLAIMLEEIQKDMDDNRDYICRGNPTELMRLKFYSKTLEVAQKLAYLQCKCVNQKFITFAKIEETAFSYLPLIRIQR